MHLSPLILRAEWLYHSHMGNPHSATRSPDLAPSTIPLAKDRRLPGFKGPYPSTALDKRAGYSLVGLILMPASPVVKRAGAIERRANCRGAYS